MVSAIAILATITGLAHGQPAGEKPPAECCETKTVGGVTYTLSGQMDTKMYNCLNDCVYQKEGQTGAKFCFAMGDKKVECNDEQMGGSDKPPMEGTGQPPMEGSEKPPMEGSEKPPMEGSEKPPMEGLEKPPVGEASSQAPGSEVENGGPSVAPEGGNGGQSIGPEGENGGQSVAPGGGNGGQSAEPEGGNEGQSEAPGGGNGGPSVAPEGGNGGPSVAPEGGNGGETKAPGGGNEGGECTYPEGHTMNLYSGPAAECGYELLFSGLDQATKDKLLKKHNELRQKVASGGEPGQPSASNMRKFVWNDELEKIAQRWTGQCKFEHDELRNMCDGTLVGQNAYFAQTDFEEYDDEVAIEASVQAWYNEVTNPGFSSSDISPFKFGEGWGHYSQVAWAETFQFGCGRVYYSTEDSWYTHLVICNYAVAGNLEGGAMYKEGEKCSKCPAGTTCDTTFDALCA